MGDKGEGLLLLDIIFPIDKMENLAIIKLSSAPQRPLVSIGHFAMALSFDVGSGQPESSFRLAKVFLLGFFIGETFLLLLLGALSTYS